MALIHENHENESVKIRLNILKTTTFEPISTTTFPWDQLPTNDSNSSVAFCKQILLEEINGHRSLFNLTESYQFYLIIYILFEVSVFGMSPYSYLMFCFYYSYSTNCVEFEQSYRQQTVPFLQRSTL